jgi:hypothetical protein
VVVGRAVNEATGFDKESLNRSMKMTVPTMGPNTELKPWKRNFHTFLSLKAAYLIPQLALRDSGVWLDEVAQTYAYAMLLHATSDNKRVEQAIKCISVAHPDCTTAAWDIMCERLDNRSFARSLSLLNNMMLHQRPGHSLTECVHFMRKNFDDYNETCEMIDGFASIHPHNLGLLMLRGISSSGHFGLAKHCVINAFDYLISADEVMAGILHLAQNVDEDTPDMAQPPTNGPAPPISTFVAAGRGSHSGRGQNPRGTRGGRGLPNKCSACGSLNHILSSCTVSDDALLKWTLAKRKLIIQKYGTPVFGSALAHAAMLSDVPSDDPDSLPTLEECTDEFDDTGVSVPFTLVAFSSSLAPGRDLSQFWVVDSACSINLTAFRHDFVTFDSPSTPSRVGGVGVDVKGSGTLRLSILLASSQFIHRTNHALYTLDLSSRSTQRIGHLLNVSWIQSNSGCEFISPPNSDTGVIVGPTGMGVLKPSGNAL